MGSWVQSAGAVTVQPRGWQSSNKTHFYLKTNKSCAPGKISKNRLSTEGSSSCVSLLGGLTCLNRSSLSSGTHTECAQAAATKAVCRLCLLKDICPQVSPLDFKDHVWEYLRDFFNVWFDYRQKKKSIRHYIHKLETTYPETTQK